MTIRYCFESYDFQNRLVIWLLIDTLNAYIDKMFLVGKVLTLICAKKHL